MCVYIHIYVLDDGAVGSSFRGVVDSVFVYSTALSVSEIESLRLSSFPVLPPIAGSAGYALSLNAQFDEDVQGDNQFLVVESHPIFSTLSEVYRRRHVVYPPSSVSLMFLMSCIKYLPLFLSLSVYSAIATCI